MGMQKKREISQVTYFGQGKSIESICEANKVYGLMEQGVDVTEKMKQDWKRKPYYMTVKEDNKHEKKN